MTAPAHPAYGVLRPVTATAGVVLCRNPGIMELEGTNTWIVRAPGSHSAVVVDPGPDDAEHLERVAALGPVAAVIVTHRHDDHTGGIEKFRALTGADVYAVLPEYRRGGGGALEDGTVLDAAGVRLRVLATPGHTADSVSLIIEPDGDRPGAVLTGDTILGRGTTVIDPEDGSLRDYLESLERLISVGAGAACLPAHGPDLPDTAAVAREYRAHRQQRLSQVRDALAVLGELATARQVVEQVYRDVDESLWPAAEWSVAAQLDYLRG
ncbi:MBL fold metallo-hydrolase [Tomitella cavernea]|uniref:MBL fold metallo-hydrolase n=1 Tax=Tomitella cavernea TaxID=1387982 RepID=UPI0027DD7041|nr:MBL fold metallo-hydrolase [Tomitella cavernea]